MVNEGADIGMFDVDESAIPVAAEHEEAPLDIDPALYLPQQETAEYVAHTTLQQQLAELEDPMGKNLYSLILYLFRILI